MPRADLTDLYRDLGVATLSEAGVLTRFLLPGFGEMEPGSQVGAALCVPRCSKLVSQRKTSQHHCDPVAVVLSHSATHWIPSEALFSVCAHLVRPFHLYRGPGLSDMCFFLMRRETAAFSPFAAAQAQLLDVVRDRWEALKASDGGFLDAMRAVPFVPVPPADGGGGPSVPVRPAELMDPANEVLFILVASHQNEARSLQLPL